MSEEIKIYQYNPKWGESYENQLKRVKKNIPGYIKCHFMHVGSTSIPGCFTSGDMDIAVGVVRATDLITVRDVLAANGFKYRPELSRLHHYVVTRAINGTLTVKVRILQAGSPSWHEMYVFKNYLIRHNDVRDAYNSLRYNMTKIPNFSLEDYEKEKIKFQRETVAKVK